MRDLGEIWDRNADNQNPAQADIYLAFLNGEIGKLAQESSPGQLIEDRPGLRFQVIRKRRRGHGHVVIFRERADHLEILRVFHTAQDWASRI